MTDDEQRSAEARALAERALTRLLAGSAPTSELLIVLGGLVPPTLTSDLPDVPAHLGTTDVDVLLVTQLTADRDLGPIERALETMDFAPERDGWRWRGRIDDRVVRMEFLCDLDDQPAEAIVTPSGCRELRAVNLRGTGNVEHDHRKITLDGPDGPVRVRIAALAGYLLSKSAAARSRGADKDYYDLAYVLLHNHAARDGHPGPRGALALWKRRASVGAVLATGERSSDTSRRLSAVDMRDAPPLDLDDSYDRLFPNQDTMPAGGFGNLIALPLQHARRADGCTVFLGEDLEPCPDQWVYLAGVQRLDGEQAEQVAAEAERAGGTLGLPKRPDTYARARPRQLTHATTGALEVCLRAGSRFGSPGWPRTSATAYGGPRPSPTPSSSSANARGYRHTRRLASSLATRTPAIACCCLADVSNTSSTSSTQPAPK